jgi:protein-S-isoprenylcysteine O-methyltransferase
MSVASYLGLLYLVSEVGLSALKRAKVDNSQAADRGSLRMLWVVIGVSVLIAYLIPANAPRWNIEPRAACLALGLILFIAGLSLRWYAISYLGRFFTVNVAIAADHKVIDSGPYRHVRHPSYSGALLAFVGLGLCLCNWGSLALLSIAPFLAFLARIRVEEAALSRALGASYVDYMRRTKRLIPALY